jgi:signal transduction histidine kinase
VFCNLIGNALKYAPAGSEVTVSCAAEPGCVRVTVSDSGPGIDKDELPHLFQRYFRTRQAQGTEGLGLGLYASALIVRAHGGTIEAESEPGQGSRFHVTLPLAAR